MVRAAILTALLAAHPGAAPATAPPALPPGDGVAADSVVTSALRKAFSAAGTVTVEYRPVVVDSGLRAAASAASRSPFADDTLRLYACLRGDSLAGYGVMDNVRGKSRDITYLVALTPAGEVSAVEILVYRESHGGEVATAAFRDQFRGKRPGDRLVPGRDIRTISGATISSRSITSGVARLVAAFAHLRGRR